MNIDIKHKHAGHLIVIEGHPFKANNAGRWNLTEIWRTLKLPQGKAPAQWRTKQAKRMEAMQNLHSSNGSGSWATKRATLGYAGWVSVEFEEMVFDAFEAVLDRPEVAEIVAAVMTDLGRSHSAAILQRMTFNDKCDWKAFGRRTPKKLTAEQKVLQKYQRQAAAQARRDRLNGREGC